MRTYGQLVHATDWIITHAEPHVVLKLKAVFTKINKSQTKDFLFKDTPENANDLLWFTSRYPLEVPPMTQELLESRAKQYHTKRAELEVLMRPEYQPRLFALKKPLRHYQAQAVELYLAHQILMVGDDVGLGKSPLGIGSFCDSRTMPACVVVQTHLPTQWREQIAKFTDLSVHLIKGTRPYSLPPADVYVMKYSCIGGWIDTFKLGWFNSVIFDEIQELRLDGSQKHAAGQELARNSDFVLGLTATPIYNYGVEIYNLINLMKEGALGEKQDFLREWTNDGRMIKDPKALGSYLREQFLFLRRTRAEVGMELPPVNTIVHTVDYDQAAVDKVQNLAEMLAIKITTGAYTERGQAARELDIMVRQATGVSKAKYVAEYVKILLENGEPVLLAAWHRDVWDILNEELKDYKPMMYTGTESPAQKDATKAAFMKGESKLMFISLRSGVGLDGLQELCSIIVIAELDWSPAIHHQLIGRINRDGQKKPVTAIYLVSDSGSDPLIVDLLGIKASQAQAIVDPELGVQAKHTDESRIQLLAKQYLKKKEQNELVQQELYAEVPKPEQNPAAATEY